MINNPIHAQQNKKNDLVVLFIYLSVFINSYVFFKEPFEFYFGYLIFIVLLPGYIIKYGFNGNLFFIFFILLVSGLVNVFLGNNTSGLFFKVYTGLTLSYFFYYYVIVDFEYDIEQLFSWYLKGAYVVALIGIFQFISFKVGFYYGYEYHWIFNKWGLVPGGMFGIRVNSVFAEPTHLGTVLSAAFFISVYNMLQKETFYLTRFQSLVIIAVYILSFSSLGQTGIFLTFLLLAINFGLVRYVVVLVPAAIILFNSLYNNLADFKGRLDGLIYLFSGQQFKVGQTHGSSFILYNNYVVAMQNFKTNFVFGTGIGSHPIAFEKYSIAKNIKIWGFNLNSADANSMLLRLISETGLFGVIIFLFIIIKCYVRRDTMHETFHWLVSNAILIMMLLNLFRQGHYFLNGFPFFVMLYCFNYFSYKQSKENSLLYTAED
jgi:hypothetical protein